MVARLRYSLAEAQAEATRRAVAFVAARPDRSELRLRRAFPAPRVSPCRDSRHPVAWIVAFAPIPPEDGVIDGGELLVSVDLESVTVSINGS